MPLTSLPLELRSKMQSCKVLVVGAGGIGCELLKNLVLTGFSDIEVLDLDTIDVSNLNRQFLFQRKHVGRPKAEVAKESCLKFNPNVKITAHCANIMSKEYDMQYFKQFDVVMNALDNRAARAHVNRMCLGANVPLIESGTSGYAGQVELIYKGLTPCYECVGAQEPKTFPACTIRTTPTEHIHCTIWAKFLFNQLFGETPEGDDEEVLDIRADGNNYDQSHEAPKNDKDKPKASPRQWAQETGYDPEKLFNKFFFDDIKYNLSMKDLWVKRKPPTPISWNQDVSDNTSTEESAGMNDQKMWSFEECKKKFAEAVKALKTASEQLGEGENLVWDKDDDAAMDFVASTANIRAHVYDIGRKSRFDIKAMAGNIIPAIATSNAVVAGMIVLFAMKILNKKMDDCKTAYLRNMVGFRGGFITAERCFPPRNPGCIVCSSNQLSLVVDITQMTLKELEKLVLRGKLSMIEPEVMMDQKVLISSEEGETDHLADKTLAEAGVGSASILKVEDFVQNYEVKIIVVNKKMNKDEAKFILLGNLDDMKNATKDLTSTTTSTNGESSSTAKPSTPQEDNEDEDIVCTDEQPSSSGLSIKRATHGESSIPVKKRRTDDCIILD